MQPTDFLDNKPGRVIKTPKGYWAFIPHPLPPPLSLSWDFVRQLSEADRSLSELAGVARTLPNPYLLIGSFIRREAVLSSRIEGTQASLSDLFFFEAAESTAKQASDTREVSNYVKALEYALKRLKEFPMSLRLIREIHEHLMQGVRGDQFTPGEFRKSQNWIGPPGCQLMNATFIPPPVEEMQDALGEFERFLHAPPALPPLVRLALVHYQFEAIHPFLDGNGRVGRLLIPFLLCADGLLPQPLLYLSAFFERHREDYYRLLLEVSRQGNWMAWVTFFLQGVAEQSQDAIRRSQKLLGLRDEYRRRLQSARASALLLTLVDDLFSSPVVTVGRAAARMAVTPRAAQLNIQKLVDKGILTEATGRQRNRVFVATAIVTMIEAATAD